MLKRALVVGGNPEGYHRLEPAEAPLRAVIEGLGMEVDFSGMRHPDGGTDYVGDYSALNKDNLQKYDLLVLYTTCSKAEGADVDAVIEYVESGKAIAGIHCATDSFSSFPAFISMMGARFRTHPEPLDIELEIVDPEHPIMQDVKSFTVKDELYLFTNYDPAKVHLLAQTHSYDDNGPVPLCWTREQGAGRIFYLSLGHFAESMANAEWQKLFGNGVKWALKQL